MTPQLFLLAFIRKTGQEGKKTPPINPTILKAHQGSELSLEKQIM